MQTQLDAMQTKLMIQDLKAQLSRLSEERALFYALLTQKDAEIQRLSKEIDELKRKLGENEDNDKSKVKK